MMDALKRLCAKAKVDLGGSAPIGSQRGIVVTPEQEKAFRLFMTHGEALVEALEKSLAAMERVQPQVMGVLPVQDVQWAIRDCKRVFAAIKKDAGGA